MSLSVFVAGATLPRSERDFGVWQPYRGSSTLHLEERLGAVVADVLPQQPAPVVPSALPATPVVAARTPEEVPLPARQEPVPLPPEGLAKKPSKSLERFAERLGLQQGELKETVVQARSSDSVFKMLQAAGLDKQDANAMVDALSKKWNARRMQQGQLVSVVRDSEGNPHGLFVQKDALKEVFVQRSRSGGYTSSIAERPVTTDWTTLGGNITSSFARSADAAGVSVRLQQQVKDAFKGRVNFSSQLKEGDSFKLVYAQRSDEYGNTVGESELQSAVLELSGKTYAMYAHRENDKVSWYDRNGKKFDGGNGLMSPIEGKRVTSGFGYRRHPILGYRKMHRGVDYGVPIGTPVKAPSDGVIKVAGRLGGYGNYVRLQHDKTYGTAYGHLSRFAPGIKPGSRVKQGQIIAYTGNTGRSTGPHLHYEVLKNGVQVNPKTVTAQFDQRLKGEQLASFREHVRKADMVLGGSGTRVAHLHQ